MTLQRLAVSQHGVLTRRQLNECGVDADRVRNKVASGRWRTLGPTLVVSTTGALSVEQRRWAAVLQCWPIGALDGLTALGVHGLRGWDREELAVIAGKDASARWRMEGTTVRFSRRPLEQLLSRRSGPPLMRVEPATLLHASRCRSTREAQGLLAAVVQQRLSSPQRLAESLADLRPLRRSALLRQTLAEIGAGAGSLAEIDVTTMCRDAGLVPPTTQVRRRDAAGRLRFTDCEWHLPDGRILILEVDGGFHMEVEHWESGIQRTRRVLDPRMQLVRATARELRDEPASVAVDLVRLGVPRMTEVVGPTTRSGAC